MLGEEKNLLLLIIAKLIFKKVLPVYENSFA